MMLSLSKFKPLASISAPLFASCAAFASEIAADRHPEVFSEPEVASAMLSSSASSIGPQWNDTSSFDESSSPEPEVMDAEREDATISGPSGRRGWSNWASVRNQGRSPGQSTLPLSSSLSMTIRTPELLTGLCRQVGSGDVELDGESARLGGGGGG